MTTSLHTPGATVGPWKLLNLLGGGPEGEVWAAVDQKGSIAAVKLFRPEQQEAAEQEFLTGKSLHHPNLLQPLSFSAGDGVPWMAMPFCKDRSADNVAGFFSEKMAWKLLQDISGALSFLHAEGLCHGDVNPSNILWDGQHFLLADFGSCAKSPDEKASVHDSSWQYAAPEKVKCAASDIWSLGASVFHLVMGTQVFNGMGGKSQRKDSVIPYMRKSMPELSRLVVNCLHYELEARPTATVILDSAREGMEIRRPVNRPLKTQTQDPLSDTTASFWPEEMKDAL